MICPHCDEYYTPQEPCSCQTPLRVPEVQPGPLHVAGHSTDEDLSSALLPTGLDNPFWKA